jgi:hypothetical protein
MPSAPLRQRTVLTDVAHTEVDMPAKSKAQQMAAGDALSAKRGDRSPGSLKGASKSMYDSMSETQLREFASAKQKGKPRQRAKH